MIPRRIILIAALCESFVIMVALGVWLFIESNRRLTEELKGSFQTLGWVYTLPGFIYRDCAVAPSPAGRFVIASVRRRDTNGDGAITVRDAKALIMIDESHESSILCGDSLVWQDKPIRWSADGRYAAFALPGLQPGWTYFDPTDIVIYDPAVRRELRRYRGGINPLWLDDGRLAFQRENDICVADGDTIEVLPMPSALRGRNLLRFFAEDPWRGRIIASYSGIADVRMRTEAMLASGKPGNLFEWRETASGWSSSPLQYDGFAPRPAKDGLYYFAKRGDQSGNGTYELAQDGVNLMRDGMLVAEDVALNSFFDLSGMRAILLRREGKFDLAVIDDSAQNVRTVVKGLKRHGATWVARDGERTIMSAMLDDDVEGPSLYELTDSGALVKLVDSPVTPPAITRNGAYCIRAAGSNAGEVLFVPW